MATGDEARVYQTMLDAVKTFNDKPENSFPVSIPNKDFEVTTFPYLDVQDFRADRNGPTLGSLKLIAGIFQVTVIVKRGTGQIEAKEIASRIIEHFAMPKRLYGDDICVEIIEQANDRPPIYENTEMRIPVTIPYRSYV